ncbi:DUF397 domain-containing protein [Streptomyces sp. NPDC004610]|uniref:DUF397 domain-containing protein n=1 Tax=unclassified Streptomyces TaxID=2593676 RepID=UPI0033A7D475
MTDTTLDWFKSSYSVNEISECVEVALASQTIHVRDSKRADSDQLAFVANSWDPFLKMLGEA